MPTNQQQHAIESNDKHAQNNVEVLPYEVFQEGFGFLQMLGMAGVIADDGPIYHAWEAINQEAGEMIEKEGGVPGEDIHLLHGNNTPYLDWAVRLNQACEEELGQVFFKEEFLPAPNDVKAN